METTSTPFDLNQAIQQWRDGLAQSPAIRGENLDELEVHLRDSVATLQARDLSAEEAFLVATKRVGSGAVLGKEFGKVNAVNVWVERCLWALVALQVWGVIQSVCFGVGYSLQFGRMIISESALSWSVISEIIFGSAIPMAFAALIIWRLFKSPKSRIGCFLENISNQPKHLAALLFVLNVGGHLCYAYALNFSGHSDARASLATFTYFLPSSFCYAGLIFILARKRLLKKA